MFNRKGNYSDHIEELSRKGRIAMNKIWRLGERICKDDFIRRWMLYRYLMQSVMEYGVEIWGWKKKELEKIRWGIRAVKYEEKIRGKEEERLKMCWKEKGNRKEEDLYSKEREKYYNRNGWGIDAIKDLRNREINIKRD